MFMRGVGAMAERGQLAASGAQVHQVVTRVAHQEERVARAEVGVGRVVSIEAQDLRVHRGQTTGRPVVVVDPGAVRRVYVAMMEIRGVVGTVAMDV